MFSGALKILCGGFLRDCCLLCGVISPPPLTLPPPPRCGVTAVGQQDSKHQTRFFSLRVAPLFCSISLVTTSPKPKLGLYNIPFTPWAGKWAGLGCDGQGYLYGVIHGGFSQPPVASYLTGIPTPG